MLPLTPEEKEQQKKELAKYKDECRKVCRGLTHTLNWLTVASPSTPCMQLIFPANRDACALLCV